MTAEQISQAKKLYLNGRSYEKQNLTQQAYESYRQAAALIPTLISSRLPLDRYRLLLQRLAPIHWRLSLCANRLGFSDIAINAAASAIRCDFDQLHYWQTFLDSIQYRYLCKSTPLLEQLLLQAFQNRSLDPQQLALPAFSLLEQSESWQILSNRSISLADKAAHCSHPLLLQLLRRCLTPSLAFEKTMRNLRKELLLAMKDQSLAPFSQFIQALACQCFYHEFLWPVEKELEEPLARLASLHSPQPVETALLCCFMAPKEQTDLSDADLFEIYRKNRSIEQSLIERQTSLSCSANPTSNAVQEQYEEYPYPCWQRLRFITPHSVKRYLLRQCIECHKRSFRPVKEILVAGCGTGKQPLETARTFRGCQVTAVDLSRQSLAYAERKAAEFDIDNIRFIQGDLLQTEELSKTFDLIEAYGVLHHMESPFKGWQTLTAVLADGGLMGIGLYSYAGRADVRQAQTLVKGMKGGIIASRESLIERHSEACLPICSTLDFFSASLCKDLLFHQCEKNFTLPQIAQSLDELKLVFLGFEDPTGALHRLFERHYGSRADRCDLMLWHELEQQEPTLFAAMYRFWVLKRPNASLSITFSHSNCA